MHSKKQIGLGTAAIGRPQYINVRQEQALNLALHEFRQQGMTVLQNAFELGVRYFDTAPGYGMAEQMVQEWISRQDESEIEVATKWGYTYTANFDPAATTHEVKEHSLSKLKQQWSQSKKLLPQLSTYQIHSATFDSGVLNNPAILQRMAQLSKEHGLLLGLSTTGSNQMEVIRYALEITVDEEPLFDVFQATYNLFDQSIAQIAPKLRSMQKRLVIKEALANGRIFPNKTFLHYEDTYTKLQSMAKKYKVGVDAIALRFCLDSVPNYVVLSGAQSLDHLRDNLKALEFSLDVDDVAALRGEAVDPSAYWNERKQLIWS